MVVITSLKPNFTLSHGSPVSSQGMTLTEAYAEDASTSEKVDILKVGCLFYLQRRVLDDALHL